MTAADATRGIADGEIECYANFQVFQIREKFSLGAMVYQGRLEL